MKMRSKGIFPHFTWIFLSFFSLLFYFSVDYYYGGYSSALLCYVYTLLLLMMRMKKKKKSLDIAFALVTYSNKIMILPKLLYSVCSA